MSKALMMLVITGTLLACREVEPREEQATIPGYDASRTSCGGCWILQGQENQLRSLELPTAYQQANLALVIRYELDMQRPTSCSFVKLTSIRTQ
jgi:hypothetical protein